MSTVAAVDLGESSGRVMVGEVDADRLHLDAVARFVNEPVALPDGLHWNVLELHRQAVAGLRTAVARHDVSSVGIDSWAVDYGLLRGDRLLGLPYHYRDARCAAGVDRVHAIVSHAELYGRNGLQFLPFNTVYQLAADDWTRDAEHLLLIPDLIGHWLTGAFVAERTNASTTGLLRLTTGEWDADLAERVGLPPSLLPPLVDPGTEVGSLRPALGLGGARLVAVGSHDTASAVVGVPMTGDDAAYISCGTWGLVGVELDRPVLTEAARAANFTNEGGVDGRIRFLTNVMGTWLLSETMRTWGTDLAPLLAAAADVPSTVPVFDVQDARFAATGDMPSRIAAWFAERDAVAPSDRATLVRSIIESLATAYARALDTAADLSGRRIGRVHVVGGGALNGLLCQAVADHSGLPVIAGPVEATALGNVLVQARAVGTITGDLETLRDLVARTQALQHFEPRVRVGRCASH
ncbi:MAG: rhamnulokinase [Jatrophihabitans sp.]|uniref:rhamnulokinase n=1 Tax=Jatrophihabitans sp. TaxID=1932789 RepID=UPI003F7EFB4F